jgi:hypothetical protein
MRTCAHPGHPQYARRPRMPPGGAIVSQRSHRCALSPLVRNGRLDAHASTWARSTRAEADRARSRWREEARPRPALPRSSRPPAVSTAIAAGAPRDVRALPQPGAKLGGNLGAFLVWDEAPRAAYAQELASRLGAKGRRLRENAALRGWREAWAPPLRWNVSRERLVRRRGRRGLRRRRDNLRAHPRRQVREGLGVGVPFWRRPEPTEAVSFLRPLSARATRPVRGR